MRVLQVIVFGATVVWLLLGLVELAAAKSKYQNKPLNNQVQYDPEVLQDYQQRFGKTDIGDRYLKKHGTKPKMVGTTVGKTTVDQVLEIPVLPKKVGDFPYKHKFKWGKQPTLTELLTPTTNGPVKSPQASIQTSTAK